MMMFGIDRLREEIMIEKFWPGASFNVRLARLDADLSQHELALALWRLVEENRIPNHHPENWPGRIAALEAGSVTPTPLEKWAIWKVTSEARKQHELEVVAHQIVERMGPLGMAR